jgi:hypothetical protein
MVKQRPNVITCGEHGGLADGQNKHKISAQIQTERRQRIETAQQNMKGTPEDVTRSVAKRNGRRKRGSGI